MGAERHTTRLRRLLAAPTLLAAPGVHDAMTASLAVDAGFEAVFLAGSALAYTQLARPDVGLMAAPEIAQVLERVRDRVSAPILVDADSGFGNALNLMRTTRLFERAGASGLQIEDQEAVKRPGALTARPLVPLAEMIGKIKAAQDAREDDDFVISARTDAASSLGVDEALRRADAFAEAGADMIFVEALKDRDQMRRLVETVGGRAHLLHNVLDISPALPTTGAELARIGYAMALFPGVLVQTMADAARGALARLVQDDRTEAFAALPLKPADINALIGSPDFIARADRYGWSDESP